MMNTKESLPLTAPPKCLLASGSPTRRRLLSKAGVKFEVVPPKVDETSIRKSMKGSLPSDIALYLAETKARQVAQSQEQPQHLLTIGADQILSFEHEVVGKVKDKKELRERLKRWRGRPHSLHTACMLLYEGEPIWHAQDEATLWVRPLSDEFIEDYLCRINRSDLDTVGGYRLENMGIQLFSRIKGEHTSILGLPLFPLLQILREWKVVIH
jgi:septum formation protein